MQIDYIETKRTDYRLSKDPGILVEHKLALAVGDSYARLYARGFVVCLFDWTEGEDDIYVYGRPVAKAGHIKSAYKQFVGSFNLNLLELI
jgi:hypothetical protein